MPDLDAASVVRVLLDGEPVVVVNEATWERLKQVTGRAKDLEHLDQYHQHRNNRFRRPDGSTA